MTYTSTGFRNNLWLRVALVFLAVATSARDLIAKNVAKGRVAEPQLGSWSVSMKDGRGKSYHGTLVMLRKNGPTIEGFIRWTDGRIGFEIITGRYTPEERALELTGIEWKGQKSGSPLGRYDALLSEDGRELVKGKVVPVRGEPIIALFDAKPTIGSFNARWKDGNVEVPDELASTQIKPLMGFPLLYTNLSMGYVLGGKTVRSKHDPAALEEFSKTGESDARKLATLRLNLDRKREEFNRNVANTLSKQQVENDFAETLRSGKMLEFAQRGQKRITANAQTAVEALRTEKQIRTILNRFLASQPATPLIEEKDLTIRYHVRNKQPMLSDIAGGDADVTIEIENRTGRALRDCVVIAQAKVDVAKINQFELRKNNADEPAYDWMRVLGVDTEFQASDSVQASTRELEKARWEYERQDKGLVIYVPEWKPGVSLETTLSPIRAAMYAESAEVMVWSADGHLHVFLSHQKIADAVNKAFAPRKQSGRPNRARRSP
jgi:hypothetical protein